MTDVVTKRMASASAAEYSRMRGWWGGGRKMGGLLVALFAVLALVLVELGLSGCGSNQGSTGDGAVPGSSAVATTDDSGKIKVVASFYPMADFAQRVGGDHVEVTNLVPAGTEPHDWEPSPRDVARIQDADVLIYNGADMEGWVDDTLQSVDASKVAVVEASNGIQLREGQEDHDEDADAASAKAAAEAGPDEHEGTHDPHVWVYPLNAKKEAENIKNGLEKADPDHKDDYEANYKAFADRLDQLDREYKEGLSATPNKTIVVSHEAYGYLCDAYGLRQVPITGMDAEGEPDAQTMAKIIDQVKDQGIKTIISEDLVSPKVAQQIADAAGAECVQLNPVEGLTDEQLSQGQDYLSVMHDNLDKLVKALS